MATLIPIRVEGDYYCDVWPIGEGEPNCKASPKGEEYYECDLR
jgi:hypothetical protein